MIVLGALLAAAAGCLFGAPRLLVVGRMAIARPRTVLLLWLTVFCLGATAVAASVLWSITLALAFREVSVGFGWVIGALAWPALAVTGATAALVLTRAEPFLAGRGAASRRIDLLAAASAVRVERIGAVQVLHVASDRPVAFSSAADGGRVVVTDALTRMLRPAELRSVIEHERAHLTARHDLLLRVAGVNRAVLPSFFGAHAFDQAVHLLVELAADDAAAQVCGRAVVASALSRLRDLDGNEWAAIRAERLSAPLSRGRSRTPRLAPRPR